MTPKVAIIIFPGLNCELETFRACKRANLQPEYFRWNEDYKKLKSYDAIIIPGGFSYEDRGRSGVIASKDPLMKTVKEEATKGKPILGLCNGAQILVESGLIPGLGSDHLEMALAWNERIKKGQLLGIGFYNDWVSMKADAKPGRSPYNRFSKNVIMRIPVAHGEGRFTTQSKEVLPNLIKNDQTLFRYCDDQGKFTAQFPVNPNNAMYNLAGVCNPEGNVLALMPHPERTLHGQPLYDSLANYLTSKKTVINKRKKNTTSIKSIDQIHTLKNRPDIIITVKLKITDNEEKTIENTMKNNGFKELELERKTYYGFYTNKKTDLKNLAIAIIQTGEVLNLNKETALIQIEDTFYSYDKAEGLLPKTIENTNGKAFFTIDYDNYAGKNIYKRLEKFFNHGELKNVERGVYWHINLKKPERINDFIKTNILHNPHAMKIISLNS